MFWNPWNARSLFNYDCDAVKSKYQLLKVQQTAHNLHCHKPHFGAVATAVTATGAIATTTTVKESKITALHNLNAIFMSNKQNQWYMVFTVWIRSKLPCTIHPSNPFISNSLWMHQYEQCNNMHRSKKHLRQTNLG